MIPILQSRRLKGGGGGAAPDGTVWIAGNGQWEDGSNPGSPTWTTLQAIIDAIPSTGGWAEVPNTSFTSVLWRSTAVWPWAGAGGSGANWNVWATSVWTGKAWVKGACGGHASNNETSIYTARLTDPPAAVRMFDPPELSGGWLSTADPNVHEWGDTDAVYEAGTAYWDLFPPWGPKANHQYDSQYFDEASGKILFLGNEQIDIVAMQTYLESNTTFASTTTNPTNAAAKKWPAFWIFDRSAPTPYSAWQCVGFIEGTTLTYPSVVLLSSGLVQVILSGSSTNAFQINMSTGEYSLGASSEINFGIPGISSTWLCRRRTTSGKQFMVGAFNLTYVGLFEGTPPAASVLRASFDIAMTPESTMGSKMPGLAVVGEKMTVWGMNDRVGYYDADTDTSDTWTSGGTPGVDFPAAPSGLTNTWNGTYGSWAAIPEVGCFTCVTNDPDHNVWVFKPPTSWEIF